MVADPIIKATHWMLRIYIMNMWWIVENIMQYLQWVLEAVEFSGYYRTSLVYNNFWVESPWASFSLSLLYLIDVISLHIHLNHLKCTLKTLIYSLDYNGLKLFARSRSGSRSDWCWDVALLSRCGLMKTLAKQQSALALAQQKCQISWTAGMTENDNRNEQFHIFLQLPSRSDCCC